MSSVYLHHVLLHFPIALFITAGLVALVSLLKRSSTLDWTVTILLAFGVAIGIAAAISGLLSADHLIEEARATSDEVAGHRNAALVSLVLALAGLVMLLIHHWKRTSRWLRLTGLVIALAAGVAVTVAGDRGGRMVHPSINLTTTEHTHEETGAHGSEPSDSHDHSTVDHDGAGDDHSGHDHSDHEH